MQKNNKDNFKIRKANLKDLNDILALHFKLAKKEHREYDKKLDLDWTYGAGKFFFKDRIIKKDGFVEIIESNNKIIGYLCGAISKKSYLSQKFKYAELDNMYIEKKFRSKGIGKLLVENFTEWCKKNKIDIINVSIYSKSYLGHKFYKKTGFKEIGTRFYKVIK